MGRQTGELKKTPSGHNDWVWSVTVLQNGDLASGSDDKTIKIWDSSTGSIRKSLIAHTGYIYSLTTLRNEDLASGSYD
jgi:WD40 repeat protein